MDASRTQNRSKAYTAAGVDIEAGNKLVQAIKKIVAGTHTNGVLSDIGGFGGLFRPDVDGMESPVLVASTDGVGTKLKLAFAYGEHAGIGIDLVGMNVNDILVQGARPLFFLDYFATGKLDQTVITQVLTGIAEGCKQAGCALLGGETAEMPDMYADGEYDLAGFCVGITDNNDIVDGSSIKVGDVLIGLASSGPHSNGYSLIRKILAATGLQRTDTFPGTDRTVSDVLMAPTTIYVECVRNVMRDFVVNGMVHITGGGFYDNIPRVLPQQARAVVQFGSWPVAPVFEWLQREGGLSRQEMLQIFNCGIGYVLIVRQEDAEDILGRLDALQMPAWQIGNIELHTEKEEERIQIVFPNE